MPRRTPTTNCHHAAIILVLLSGGAWAAEDTEAPPKIPPVVLSKQHDALCKVKVGDALPAIELPRVDNGRPAKLADLFGERATVVVFWTTDRRMALAQLADLQRDVIKPFAKRGVAVVGIAVNETASTAQASLQKAGARFPNLLDARGQAFAAVGSKKLPRTYVVDSQGKILWFDIEYSHATRRELRRALRAVTRSR
jgi:peroxiredoxin